MPRSPHFPPIDVVLPKFPIRTVGIILVVLLLVAGSMSLVYTVQPDQVGIVVRLGRYIEPPTEPGLHFKLPFGIDMVTVVPIQRQMKLEFGFRTAAVRPGERTEYAGGAQNKALLAESLMVTGDLNSADVEWIVQYRVVDPRAYLFNVRNPVETLRDAAESVMREVVGDHTVDEVLTVGRQAIANSSQEKLQTLMNTYLMGIKIDQVVLQDVNPPDAVKASFNEVNQAQQERERLINESRSLYNQVVPRALGEAAQKIQEGEGYALERVNQADGDAVKFNAVFKEYLKAPEVTRRRIYLETMKKVIAKIGDKYIIDEKTRGILPLLQLESKEAGK